jgi:hypothetical protein
MMPLPIGASAFAPRRAALAVRALGWVLAAKVALRAPRSSLPASERWLARLGAALPRAAISVDEAAWAVTAAAARVPGTRCLEWALALRGLLAEARVACELRIGVRAGRPGAFEAHAWIECGDRTLSWGEARGYEVLRARPSPS